MVRHIQEHPEEVLDLLTDLANDFEAEGCPDHGTISIESMNRLRAILGWDLLPLAGGPDEAVDQA